MHYLSELAVEKSMNNRTFEYSNFEACSYKLYDYSFEILKIIRYSNEAKSLFETHL